MSRPIRSLAAVFCLLPTAFIPLHAASPPELTILRTQYDRVFSEQVTAPYDAGLTELNARYVGGLDRAIAEAKQAGDLKTVLAIEADKQRLTDKLPIPAEADDTLPPVLKKLRPIYHEQLQKLEALRGTNHGSLLLGYTKTLETLEATLTKVDRVAEAKEVMLYREGLAIATSRPVAAAPASAPPMATASPASPAPRLSKAEAASNAKRLITWALANGHAATVSIGGNEQRIEPGAIVPDGDVILVGIVRVASVPDVAEPPPWNALPGQEELREIHFAGWKQRTASKELASLEHLPALRSLELAFAVDGSVAEALPNLPDLVEMKVKPADPLAGSEFSVLARKFPNLKDVLIDRSALTDAEFTAVAGWKSLELLILAEEATPLSPGKIQTLASLPKLEHIMFYGCKPGALESEGMSMLKSVRKLQFNYNATFANLQAASAVPNLTAIILSQIQSLGDAELEVVSKIPNLGVVTIRECPAITDAGFAHILTRSDLTELGCSDCPGISATAFQSVGVLKQLQKLVVHESAFDDTALMSLTKIRSLKEIGLSKTAVTEDALNAFQKDRPDVKIGR